MRPSPTHAQNPSSPLQPDNVDNGSPFPAPLVRGLLNVTVGVLLVSSIAAAIGLRIFAPEQTIRLLGPLFMASLAVSGGYFLLRNQVQIAVRILVFGAWISLTCMLLITDGLRAPAVVAYPLVILVTGWLIGAKAAILCMAATVAASVGLWFLEHQGVKLPGVSSSASVRLADQIVIYLLSGALAAYFVRNFQLQLHRLRQVSQDLAARSRDLEAKAIELQRAQSVAKVGSWIFNCDTRELQFSPETCRILGLPSGTSETLDSSFERVHPADQSLLASAWKAMEEGSPLNCEHRILNGDQVRWLHQQAEVTAKQVEQKASSRIIGICEDITDRKLAQLALEDSEHRYRTMIEWTPEAIAVHRNGILQPSAY